MERAEELVDDLLGPVFGAKRQSRLLNGGQELLGFLEKASVLDDASTKAARKLSDLRNAYAHARGSNPQKDAISAIKHLHQVVEGTISVFKEYELKDGAFVKKNAVG